MKIELKQVSVRDLYDGYVNNQEEGVVGFGGKLNIRPKYQREFVYNEKQQFAVIDSIRGNFPLNMMYWVKNEDDNYEVLDGQQRIMSICNYVSGGYSINYQFFHNLEKSEQEQILNYEIMVYFCEGDDKEKLEWFKKINTIGERLTDQELRNAIYTGEWLSDAKKYFSKTGCVAYNLANNYMSGVPIRQDYLETVLEWISDGDVADYMSKHQHDQNALELRTYFSNVIEWVKTIFPRYRNEMKGLNYGALYNAYHNTNINIKNVNDEIDRLMSDDDVTNKKGIYYYVLTRDEKNLNIRTFTNSQKRTVYERQNHICVSCGNEFDFGDMEADHITPWIEGGRTDLDNCQVLCRKCNRRKSKK